MEKIRVRCDFMVEFKLAAFKNALENALQNRSCKWCFILNGQVDLQSKHSRKIFNVQGPMLQNFLQI